MKATGLFFLRMRASEAVNGQGQRVVLLPVVERVQEEDTGRWVTMNELLAVWKGDEALAFYAKHQADLIPGRGLELELDRLRGVDRDWRANVTRLELAPLPPSWQKQAGDEQTPQAQPA
jgi:hypothetical protein